MDGCFDQISSPLNHDGNIKNANPHFAGPPGSNFNQLPNNSFNHFQKPTHNPMMPNQIHGYNQQVESEIMYKPHQQDIIQHHLPYPINNQPSACPPYNEQMSGMMPNRMVRIMSFLINIIIKNIP